jgi:hypothetical protein
MRPEWTAQIDIGATGFEPATPAPKADFSSLLNSVAEGWSQLIDDEPIARRYFAGCRSLWLVGASGNYIIIYIRVAVPNVSASSNTARSHLRDLRQLETEVNLRRD